MSVRSRATSVGRFLQPDPIVQDPFDPQGLSRYAYVRNDPVNQTDPTGAQSCDGCSGSATSNSYDPGTYGIEPYDPFGGGNLPTRLCCGAQVVGGGRQSSLDPAAGRFVGALNQFLRGGGASQRLVEARSSQGTEPLSSTQQQYLEYITGESFAGVRLDEGFLGESFASGMVRSDREINVATGFSSLDPREQLARLTHEGTHILQLAQEV